MKVGLYNTVPMLGLLPPQKFLRRKAGIVLMKYLKLLKLFQISWLETVYPTMIFKEKGVTGENNGEFQIWKLENGTLRESYLPVAKV